MSSAQISLAFAAGMLATVNPCGFALLPAYLGFFLGIDANTDDRDASVPQALAIGGAVSLGFVAVFGLLGIVLRSSLSFFQRWLPYVSVVIGIGLLVMGALLLAGKHIAFAAPKLKVGKRQRTFWSMFVYGISYAIASLGCTIGPFVSTVAGAFRRQSFGAGVVVFLAYALGMATILIGLTVTTALAKQGMLKRLRQILPYVDRVAGVLMVIAGLYVAYYGFIEIRGTSNSAITSKGSDLSTRLTVWLDETGTGRIGLFIGAAILVAVGITLVRRRHKVSVISVTDGAVR